MPAIGAVERHMEGADFALRSMRSLIWLGMTVGEQREARGHARRLRHHANQLADLLMVDVPIEGVDDGT